MCKGRVEGLVSCPLLPGLLTVTSPSGDHGHAFPGHLLLDC